MSEDEFHQDLPSGTPAATQPWFAGMERTKTAAHPAALWIQPVAARSTGPAFEAESVPTAKPPIWRRRAAALAKAFGALCLSWVVLVVVLIAAYAVFDPPLSMLMLRQKLSGQPITQYWVRVEDVSPLVVRAVLVSEDGRFCQHGGIDYDEIQNAIDRAQGGTPRGASTISQQVIKNLFLWPSRSYLRKAIEVPFVYIMETLWSKRRIMEVYLNIAEWGSGIFGVEAAAQFHFGKSARRLGEREAAQLAVALPNPASRDAGDPGPRTRRLASLIQLRARSASAQQLACLGLRR